MSNLEELDNLNYTLLENVNLVKENTDFLDSNTISLISLNIVISTYLPSIAKSLAIIADKMSEE